MIQSRHRLHPPRGRSIPLRSHRTRLQALYLPERTTNRCLTQHQIWYRLMRLRRLIHISRKAYLLRLILQKMTHQIMNPLTRVTCLDRIVVRNPQAMARIQMKISHHYGAWYVHYSTLHLDPAQASHVLILLSHPEISNPRISIPHLAQTSSLHAAPSFVISLWSSWR